MVVRCMPVCVQSLIGNVRPITITPTIFWQPRGMHGIGSVGQNVSPFERWIFYCVYSIQAEIRGLDDETPNLIWNRAHYRSCSCFHQYLSTIFANSLRRNATCCVPYHHLHHIAFFVCVILCLFFRHENMFLSKFDSRKSHSFICAMRCPVLGTHDDASCEMHSTMHVSQTLRLYSQPYMPATRSHTLTHMGILTQRWVNAPKKWKKI